MTDMPWLRSFYSFPIPPLMTREEFVAAYFPQYVRAYSSPTGIRAYVDGKGRYRIPHSTKASHQAQVSKRNNRIDSAYSTYCSQHASQMEQDAKSKSAQPLL